MALNDPAGCPTTDKRRRDSEERMAHLPVELCGVLGFACDDSGFFAFDPFAHLQDGLTASVSRSMLALFWGVQNVDNTVQVWG
jgi:hypothetical protein